ncbi:hypothetical protein M422DRAFT_259826 [Sphaerobolus stellatus SS14]|uniref:Uncharacterized protein n=1 Tax=Sphaerobolus stellatus (strain SS14) TaxID=990650 RepID=A0A0C9USD3_SPHS4|nr:hypothetical protein M422DRAFT_259826 [Sphaerobolus stellatus SS14]
MSSTFTPTNTFKEGPEKEWAPKLGGLDWDNTHIVFTKRSLVDFLRYAGVSLDTNFHNIAKLPRYADIGRLEGASEVPGVEKPTPAETPALAQHNNDYKPSRRVRSVPGGAQTFRFGDDEEEEIIPTRKVESLSIVEEKASEPVEEVKEELRPTNTEVMPETSNNEYRPSRRVRTVPGGPSSMSSLLGGDDVEAEAFKPTRRVRERPGGTDHISGIF